jgi:hypothetical protein
MRTDRVGDVKHPQKNIKIHRRAASMESIQEAFDFYDDESTSTEEDQHNDLQQHQESEGPTFELIDIVEPSEVPPENGDYFNGANLEMQQKERVMIRNISPSLPLENDSESQECDCEIEDDSRHKLRSPELVRQAAMGGRQRNGLFEEVQEDERRSLQPESPAPGLSARYERRHRTISMSTVSVLSYTTRTTRTVLSRSKSCSYLLRPEEVFGLPSDVLKPLHHPHGFDLSLKSVSLCVYLS